MTLVRLSFIVGLPELELLLDISSGQTKFSPLETYPQYDSPKFSGERKDTRMNEMVIPPHWPSKSCCIKRGLVTVRNKPICNIIVFVKYANASYLQSNSGSNILSTDTSFMFLLASGLQYSVCFEGLFQCCGITGLWMLVAVFSDAKCSLQCTS